jgi:hypothetical protein
VEGSRRERWLEKEGEGEVDKRNTKRRNWGREYGRKEKREVKGRQGNGRLEKEELRGAEGSVR